MRHSLLRTNPQRGSTNEQFLEQVPCLRIQSRNYLTPGCCHVVHGKWFVVRQLRYSRPVFLRRRAQQLENPLQLIHHIRSGEERSACIAKLSEYAARGPHVDAGRV